jgi:hypothetical protein
LEGIKIFLIFIKNGQRNGFSCGGSPYSPDLFSSPLYKLETKGSTKHGRFTRKGRFQFYPKTNNQCPFLMFWDLYQNRSCPLPRV